MSPHGLVVHAGRWYLAAYDHGRKDGRTFRVDRMTHATILAEAARAPPEGFEAVEHVSASLARVPWAWEVECCSTCRSTRCERISTTLAELHDAEAGSVLQMRVESLDWMAGVLAGLGGGFTIRRPEELRAAVRRLAEGSLPQQPERSSRSLELENFSLALRKSRTTRRGGGSPKSPG